MNKKIIFSSLIIASVISTGFIINHSNNKQNDNNKTVNEDISENLLPNQPTDYLKDNTGGILKIEATSEQSIFNKMSKLSDITDSSDVVLSGKVTNIETKYNSSVIYRLLTLEVTQVIKGDYKNNTATLFLVGGELAGDEAQDFAYSQIKDKVDDADKQKMPKTVIYNENKEMTELGQLKANDDLIVFLSSYPMYGDDTIFLPVGENQGIYRDNNGMIEIINQVEEINQKKVKDLNNTEKLIEKSDFIELIQ